ncbi:MAG: DMT family transporter [Mycobacteriales bacterium]
MSSHPVSTPYALRWLPRYLACSLIWGTGFALIKVAVDAGVPPGWVAFWRCALGAGVLWLLVLLRRTPVAANRRLWAHALVVGTVLNAAPFTLFALGEQHISSVLAGVWNSTIPLFTLVFVLVLVPDEPPTARRLTGLATGAIGALTVLEVWRGLGDDLLVGSLACLGATTLYGLGYAYTRRFMSGYAISGMSLTAMQLTGATAELAVAAPVLGGRPGWPGPGAAAALVVLGVLGTGLAYLWNLDVIRAVGSTVASTVAYLTPVWASLAGLVALGEPLAWTTVLGALLIVGGVLLTRSSGPRPAPAGRRRAAASAADGSPGTG